ncbi:hypothetical protein [Acinetobacter sp. ANC 3791]|uniref:hypothetical protein n=1 Tax=Acinetobacter sp. ANC 3791 TaxID=2529836 RepID=UPI001038DFCC|nr:hypothetical protein [Acinetobacter sp. ANC 3791]TCB83468.1 hypothetical protein E0H90_12135 [Acinetobacter sp. ANC 3791]
MKTFRNLYINLNGVKLENFIHNLESISNTPWIRRKDKEKVLSEESHILCFESQESETLPPTILFLCPQRNNQTWWVSNIIPTEIGQLTHDEYNLALMSFYEQLIKPAVNNTTITIEITSDIVTIESVSGNEVANALRRFSSAANKSTGSSHPLDQQRWFDFLIVANQAETKPDVTLVIETLKELEWSEERAYELGLQFEFAESLLTYFREHN